MKLPECLRRSRGESVDNPVDNMAQAVPKHPLKRVDFHRRSSKIGNAIKLEFGFCLDRPVRAIQVAGGDRTVSRSPSATGHFKEVQTMARFNFDLMAEEFHRGLVDVYFEMQEYKCGVRVFDDAPVAVGSKIANGRSLPTGIAVQIPEPASDEPRHAELMDRVKRYGDELIQIRRRFHPGYDIADVCDGPPEYTNAIAACKALHLPPTVSLDRLLKDAIWCDDRMVFFWSRPTREEINEIGSYLLFFDYWINRLHLPNAPESPDPAHLTPHIVQSYFRKVRAYMEVAVQGMVKLQPDIKTPPDRAIQPPSDQKPGVNRKHPTDMAIFAYRMDVFSQKSQSEIAKMIKVQYARKVSQGTVSRWIKEVKELVVDGGVLPELSQSRLPRAIPVDPAVIDLGRNSSGTTKRQRGRKSEDD